MRANAGSVTEGILTLVWRFPQFLELGLSRRLSHFRSNSGPIAAAQRNVAKGQLQIWAPARTKPGR